MIGGVVSEIHVISVWLPPVCLRWQTQCNDLTIMQWLPKHRASKKRDELAQPVPCVLICWWGYNTITFIAWIFLTAFLGYLNSVKDTIRKKNQSSRRTFCNILLSIFLNLDQSFDPLSMTRSEAGQNKATSRKNRRSTYVQFSQCIFLYCIHCIVMHCIALYCIVP